MKMLAIRHPHPLRLAAVVAAAVTISGCGDSDSSDERDGAAGTQPANSPKRSEPRETGADKERGTAGRKQEGGRAEEAPTREGPAERRRPREVSPGATDDGGGQRPSPARKPLRRPSSSAATRRFIAKADAACRSLRQRPAALIRRLRALRVPGGGRRSAALRYMALLERNVRLLREFARAVERRDTESLAKLTPQLRRNAAAGERAARAYGFKVCGKRSRAG